jgi:hypothetical protein
MKKWTLEDRIKGEELTAIQFVMDYIQIFFNHKGFSCYIWPSLNVNNQLFEFGNIDYRNKLCGFIGKTVNEVYLIPEDLLIIEFEKGDRIEININPNNPEIISEIAIFWDDDGNWAVFE